MHPVTDLLVVLYTPSPTVTYLTEVLDELKNPTVARSPPHRHCYLRLQRARRHRFRVSCQKKFHDRFAQQNYAAIYADADPKFRVAVKQDDRNSLLRRVRDKLGNVTDAARIGFYVNYRFGGSTITITYSTKFQLGEGQEQFVWQKSGDGLRLLNYNIKSPALNDSNVQ